MKRLNERAIFEHIMQSISRELKKTLNEYTLYRHQQNTDIYDEPFEVIRFEIGELGNTDIIDYCLDNYSSAMSRRDIELLEYATESLNDDSSFFEEEHEDGKTLDNVVDTILRTVEKYFGIKIDHVMWLAELDAVKDMYCDSEDDYEDIEEFETSPYILSDLGYDGILFAYTK